MRWWIPAAVFALATANLMNLYLSDLSEGPMQNMGTIVTVFFSLLALAAWYVFFTGLRWGTRFKLLGAGVVVLAALGTTLYFTVRIEGAINGSGWPRLVLRSTPPVGAGLPALTVTPAADLPPAGLVAGPDDYPQFLGPQRDGVAPRAHLARDWSARPPQEVWRQSIGLGWSSFAVVGDSAFTQEQRGDQELVVCYDLKTGKVRWTHADPVRFSETQGGDGPRATPTVVVGRVYALGATGILNCLDGATGKLVWTRETLQGVPNLIWGKSSSPLIVDNLVLVSGGYAAGPSLLAYDKDSGNTVWQVGHDKSSYSSPALADLAGRRQVVVVNATSVTGHDSADGNILWEYSWPGEWAKASQPVVLDDGRVFLSAGYGVGCVMLQVKDQGDGTLAASELWSNRYLKTQFSNVLVRDGFVYGLDDGMLTCLDLKTGKRKWKGGRYGYGQVLLAGDLILVQAEPGSVVLVEATPDRHHELARLPALKGKTWNNPALAGLYLLVRNDQEAACYKLPLEDK
jgi:outer membrane protein assembly factor BamB